MLVYDLATVQALGAEAAAVQALDYFLGHNKVAAFWIHLDADVIDDAAMPAVDYRLPGGLSTAELTMVLRALMESGKAVGAEITVFNPTLDQNGTIARRLVRSIAEGLVLGRGG